MKTVKTRPVISFVMILAMVLTLTMAPMSSYAVTSDHDRISVATGEPVVLQWDGPTSTGGAIVTNSAINYYPSSFVLYAYDTVTAPSSAGATLTFLYNTPGGDAYRVDLPNSATTISVTLADSEYGGNREYILRCQAPQGIAPGGTTPEYINGYLQVGQYATGTGWGSIFSNGTNSTGTTPKLLNGYESTGVSLGSGGGYVQFEFDDYVENSDDNPFGIDFIIYGNAFNGNPEAGAVKVSEDGTNWYDLAGSLYYNEKSINNVDVAYKISGTAIYYNFDGGGWTLFRNTASWWPTYGSTDYYGSVSGISTTFGGSVSIGDVVWNSPYEQITFQDLCLVKDTDNTDDYRFGYFDVRANGSNYGTAVNPYATAPTANTGGDGFDISWAVDEDGYPVDLAGIKYVRAYTTATLNTTGDAFTVPGIFGETSAEVCGIYTANGTGSGATMTAPVVEVNSVDQGLGLGNNMSTVDCTGLGTNTASISVSGGIYIFINGVATSSATIDLSDNQTHFAQIIVQSGTASPYIVVLELSK